MLGHAKGLLFGAAKQLKKNVDDGDDEDEDKKRKKKKSKNKDASRIEQDQAAALSCPQAPPTPKVKKQRLRALDVRRDETGQGDQNFASTPADTRRAPRSEVSGKNKTPTTTTTTTTTTINSANSSASSGYQSSSLAAAAACSLPEGSESINQDYSHHHHQSLFYAPTCSTNETTGASLDENGNFRQRQNNPRLGAPSKRQAALEASQASAAAAAATQVRGHSNTAPSYQTRQRHFYNQLQASVRVAQPPMVPIMIDDDDEDEEEDNGDESGHEDDAGDNDPGDLFCQFETGMHRRLNDGQALVDAGGDLEEDENDELQLRQQNLLIDGRRDLSWRQRQAALSLGKEAQQRFQYLREQPFSAVHLRAAAAAAEEQLEEFSGDEQQDFFLYGQEAASANHSFHHRVPFRQLKQNTYANTKRMLITAGQLNGQQQLYKQQPFDAGVIYAPGLEPTHTQVHYQTQQILHHNQPDLHLHHHQQHLLDQDQLFGGGGDGDGSANNFPHYHQRQANLSLLLSANNNNNNNIDQEDEEFYSLARSTTNTSKQAPRLPPKSNNNNYLTYRPHLGSGMQTSTSRQQLAPLSQQHSPYHHQQVRRSKSAQQQQQQQQQHQQSAPKVNKLASNINNFQLQQTRQQVFPNLNKTTPTISNSDSMMDMHQQRRLHDLTRSRSQKGSAKLELSCCGKFAKFLLFLTNAMFWSAGVALGAWGILALVDDHKYNLSQLLVFEQGTRMSLFQLLAWSFITLGCATILVGFCGCSAMFKNNRWILGLYIFLILAIFALDLATGLLAIIFQERLVANVRLRLVSKLKNEYGIQASFTAAIDYIQTRYECCGLEGHFDYDQSLWRLQRLGGFEATVARTCCHLRNTFDDQAHVNPRPLNESMCQSTDIRFHQSYRYRRGCLDDLERLIRQKIWTFTIGSGAVGAVILLSLVFATCFCRSIPSSSRKNSPESELARAQATQQQIASLSYLVEGSQGSNSGNHSSANKKQGHSVPHYR